MIPCTESGTGRSSVCVRAHSPSVLHEQVPVDEHADELLGAAESLRRRE